MAKERVIALIGGISTYGMSHEYIKYMMDDLGEGPITVKCTSLGGDLNEALLIKAMFETHGEVTVEYIGFNASAATILGHGATKTLIREDSLYLIHKPSVWIDTWGRMNVDELTAAIVELEGEKKDAEKVTLMIVQDYVNSRGMEISLVEKLMKDSRWLTASEAVELGLVDELIPVKTKKTVITNEALAMMSANGYPVPVFNEGVEDSNETPKQGILQSIINKLSTKNETQMHKDFICVNAVLAVDAVNVVDGKVTLTVEQITALNARLQALDSEVTNLTTERDNATAAKTTADTAKATAEAALADFTNKVNQINPTVAAASDADAKVVAINAILATRPGAAAATPQGAAGAQDHAKNEADFDAIDKLPHNQAADKELY